MPGGPSQLEIYAEDDQTHERVAMGLERLPQFARAGDTREGFARHRWLPVVVDRSRVRADAARRSKKKANSKDKEENGNR